MRFLMNPLAARGRYTRDEARVVSHDAAVEAQREISSWEGAAMTPVRSLQAIATELGLATVLLKDESGRLGQGSFKSLGGGYAAIRQLRARESVKDAVFCCATEGNHGRSVALAAARLGCSAVVYMSEDSLDYKAAAIEALGARVIRIKGTYDDAVRLAREAAQREGWLLTADTGEPGDTTVNHIMQGYGVMVLELLEQLPPASLPTHVFIQGGVGGLAAGVAGVFSDVLGEARPTLIVVEPETAACLMESALRFAPAKVTGDLRTNMKLLAVGEASPAAWSVLSRRIDAFMTIEDEAAVDARLRLKKADGSRPSLDIGLSGVAGLAGLIELAKRQPRIARLMGLDGSARVLVIGTEAGPPMNDQCD
jgi:diaminopropionate ammonia-lyase